MNPLISRYSPSFELLPQAAHGTEQDSNVMNPVMNVPQLDMGQNASVPDLVDMQPGMAPVQEQDQIQTGLVAGNQISLQQQLQQHLQQLQQQQIQQQYQQQVQMTTEVPTHLSLNEVTGTVLLPPVLHGLQLSSIHDSIDSTEDKELKTSEMNVYPVYANVDAILSNYTTFQNHNISDLKLSDIPQLLNEYKFLVNYLLRNSLIEENANILEFRDLSVDDISCDIIPNLVNDYKALITLVKRTYSYQAYTKPISKSMMLTAPVTSNSLSGTQQSMNQINTSALTRSTPNPHGSALTQHQMSTRGTIADTSSPTVRSHSSTSSPTSLNGSSITNHNQTTGTVNNVSSVPNDGKYFECTEPNCTARFKTKSALTTHYHSAHSTMKLHVCKFIGCGKRFATEWQLRQHVVRHPQNHRYTCKQCNHTFAYPYQLNRHLAKHTNNKPYHCSYPDCNKQFAYKGALLMHEKAHEKLFICNICLKRFGYKCDLNRHMVKHSNVTDQSSSTSAMIQANPTIGPQIDTNINSLPSIQAISALQSLNSLQIPSIDSLSIIDPLPSNSEHDPKSISIQTNRTNKIKNNAENSNSLSPNCNSSHSNPISDPISSHY